MKLKLYHTVVFIAISLILSDKTLSAQDYNPYHIIDTLKSKLEKIHDYQADIEIEVDVDFINMPVKKAVVYFKQPDKIKFKSDEFIMLPKRGFNNQMMKILDEPYNAIYVGKEDIKGKNHHVLKIIPMGKKPQVVLATWWIDQNSFLISKTESNTRDEGTFTIEFEYNDNFILPTEMLFSFEIENLNIPLKFMGKAAGIDKEKLNQEEIKTGKVFIRFSNYQVNKKMSDDFFEETEN
ncbi:MAG: outer membrane lipoprotein-sorting protein [Bacteroidales bacterium]|nr:outer membrane lipoprotein-sorting protein [Bacteroidales bacterium]